MLADPCRISEECLKEGRFQSVTVCSGYGAGFYNATDHWRSFYASPFSWRTHFWQQDFPRCGKKHSIRLSLLPQAVNF